MNEIWRVLKPGGILYASTPAYPHNEAFQDPTHVNFITEKTVEYFMGNVRYQAGHDIGKMYGFIGRFAGEQNWSGCYLKWNLQAIK